MKPDQEFLVLILKCQTRTALSYRLSRPVAQKETKKMREGEGANPTNPKGANIDNFDKCVYRKRILND